LRLGYAQFWIEFLNECVTGRSGLRPVFVQGWAPGRGIGGAGFDEMMK
jgi:hypothetical protein